MSQVLNITTPVALTRHILSCRELRTKYETNRMLPLLDTFLVLKNYCGQPGLLRDLNEAAQFCKINYKTLVKRLRALAKLEWLELNLNSSDQIISAKLHSWKQVYQTTEINYSNEFTTTPYNLATTERLQDRLWTIDFTANKLAQATTWKKKLDSNLEHKSILIGALIKQGADKFKLESEFVYFQSQMQKLYIEDFKFGSSVRDIIQLYRPFFERGISAMAKAYAMKSKQSVSYRKNILQTRGVIAVEKVKHTSNIRGRNRHCWVLWCPKKLETTLVMADTIRILNPKIKHDERSHAA